MVMTPTMIIVFTWFVNLRHAIVYHGENCGSASLNLLSGVTNPPANEDLSVIQSFTLAVDDVRMPTQTLM